MENFIGTNALLWQKLAVKVQRDIAPEELRRALRGGATFFHIECGLYTSQEGLVLLEHCNEIIKRYAEECQPWIVATGIICELSGPYPRVQFNTARSSQVEVVEQQRITLTSDVRYENQCFHEVKYVTNFVQLQRSSVGDVLSIDTVKLMVERIVPDFVTCRVTQAGFIKPFSVITNSCGENSEDEQLELDISSTLEEMERVVEKGCKFVIVPKMDSKSLHTFFESIKWKKLIAPNIQIIVHGDCFSSSNANSDMERCIDALLAKDIVALQQKKPLGKPVLYDLDNEGTMPEGIEEADVIIVSAHALSKAEAHLKLVNRIQFDIHQQSNRTLEPDGEPMATCLNFSAQEANASAIILPLEKGDPKLALELSLTNPLCIVLLLKSSAEEVHRILLRKYLVPAIVPAATNVSQQQRIRRAIAYGRRFGYLHGGNCIVTGFTLDSDTDVLGLEMRYVAPEAHRLEPQH